MNDLFLNAITRYVVREKETIAAKRKEQEEWERKVATTPTHVPDWLNEYYKKKYRGLELNDTPLRFFGDNNVSICVMFWLNRHKDTYEVTMDIIDANDVDIIGSKRHTVNFPLGLTTAVNRELFEIKFGSSQITFLKENSEPSNVLKFNRTLHILKSLSILNEKNNNINELGFETDIATINYLFDELQKIIDGEPMIDYVQAYLDGLKSVE